MLYLVFPTEVADSLDTKDTFYFKSKTNYFKYNWTVNIY